MKLRFHTLDVFTEQRFGGNPLAVVFDGEQLTAEQMQIIAREFNLSETVFVLKPTLAGALRRVRIFTPGRELPFAGHPTVGTACLLAELGEAEGAEVDIVLEEAVGPVPVSVRREHGRASFARLTTAVLPSFGPPPPPAQVIASVLGLTTADIETVTDAPLGASCGVPYLLVPLKSRRALAKARPVLDRWQALLANYWTTQLFVYCREPESADAQLRGRMFAPDLGIAEDPATGSAAVALCGALAQADATTDGTLRWTLEQGYEMERPSQLYLEADKRAGRISAVRVGGYAVRVSEGVLYV